MLSPVGSSVTIPVGLVASTICAVDCSVASPRRLRFRVHLRTPVPASRATASSQRFSVRNTDTTTPSVAVDPQSRALDRV
jgi:hypothetical protein